METVNYHGYECCSLKNEAVQLLVTCSVGPRIIACGFKGGENLFAELPDFVAQLPGGEVFHFYGGHRLWQAPEDFDTTYIPDDDPVEITSVQNGLLVIQPMQSRTGLQKSIEIVFTGESQVTVIHQIINRSANPVTCAPWAITQFKTGGMAILPQSRHDSGVLPNRSLALWNYTDMSNPNIVWGKEYIFVSAQMDSAFKIGFSNPRGWLAYWLNGTLFVKRSAYDKHARYYDFGSSSECYCNDKFLELETLAPIGTIAPNESVPHVEIWDFFSDIEYPRDERDAQLLLKKLELE